MLRRGNKMVKLSRDDPSEFAVYRTKSERSRTADNSVSLESMVFGGESNISEQLQNFEVLTSGHKVSSVTDSAVLKTIIRYFGSTTCLPGLPYFAL